MSEKSLAAAVVLQAVEDYRKPEPRKFNKKGNVSTSWSEWRRNFDDAEAFLTNTHGEWAASRETWCALAGIDPSQVMAQAAGGFPNAA